MHSHAKGLEACTAWALHCQAIHGARKTGNYTKRKQSWEDPCTSCRLSWEMCCIGTSMPNNTCCMHKRYATKRFVPNTLSQMLLNHGDAIFSMFSVYYILKIIIWALSGESFCIYIHIDGFSAAGGTLHPLPYKSYIKKSAKKISIKTCKNI